MSTQSANGLDRSAFNGQVALVTGAASGIGRAIAGALSVAGASVALADRNVEGCQEVAQSLDGSHCVISVDITSSVQVQGMVEAAVSCFGKLDVLIHSAGIGIEQPLLKTTDEQWHQIIDVDLTGTFYCMRAAASVMAGAGYGRIVALSSTAGVRGGSGRAAYGAAKAGIISLVKVAAAELATAGVTVNALAPGAIETELVARMHSADTRRNYQRLIPLDRYGTPEEVASAALFLASPAASYVTGHVLAVDGGFLSTGVLNR